MSINKQKLLINTMIAISSMYSVFIGITNFNYMILWNMVFTVPLIILSADEVKQKKVK